MVIPRVAVDSSLNPDWGSEFHFSTVSAVF